jgi:hypothetical protein
MQTGYAFLALPFIAMLTACSSAERQHAAAPAQPAATGERPMDEVPVQRTLLNGDREYSYRNGCIVVLEPRRAVVKSEGAVCQSYHRDISLLYASGD